MKIGMIYPSVELRGDPESIRAFGLAAEDLNFDHLCMFDHVIGTPPELMNLDFSYALSHEDAFHDPFVCFSYLAGITKRIEFVFGVLILPQRPVVLVARQIADLSLLSGGRVRLGVGTGWNWIEYQALNAEWTKRGKILEEQIPYLRRLLSGDVVTMKGQFHQLDGGAINPPPKQAIPIYCGGESKVALDRAARLADGFVFEGPLQHALETSARMRDILSEHERPIDGFEMHYFMNPAGPNPRDGGGKGVSDGNAQNFCDELNRWRDAGGTAASINTAGLGFTSYDQHIDLMAEVADRMNL